MKKVFMIILSYALLAFALCFGISFFGGHLPVLLDNAKSSYLLYRTLMYFFRIMPSVLASSFMIAMSIYFGEDAQKAQMRFSPLIMSHFRRIIVVSVVLVALMTLTSEIFSPLIQRKKTYAEQAPHLLTEYTRLGNECLADENYMLAHRYGTQILKIKPDSLEGRNLVDKSEAVLKAIKKISPSDIVEKEIPLYYYREVQNETVTSFIKKSKEAADNGQWFDSHYYAQMACSIGTDRDINITEARRLASVAWNRIQSSPSPEKTKEQELFLKKRSAYKALSEGDSIEAYYQFMEIAGQDVAWASDPDITQFLEIARKRVEDQCFFIDETEKLETFENYINVYFTIKHPSGVTDVVYIRGITPVSDAGRLIQYLRGLTVITFGKNGSYLKSFTVPYAKMMSVSLSDFPENFRDELELSDNVKKVPLILLESIDRNNRGRRIVPEWDFTGYIKSENFKVPGYVILSMSVEDFNTACDASVGAEKMNMNSLMDFSSKADELGFSEEVAGAALIKRVTYPIIMLMLLIFLSTIAWNFRMNKNQIFKFIWIFIIPVCTIVCDIFIQIVLTAGNLSNYLLIAVFGNSALLVSSVLWMILLVIVSIYFALRKAN
jgi:hypothetical protein